MQRRFSLSVRKNAKPTLRPSNPLSKPSAKPAAPSPPVPQKSPEELALERVLSSAASKNRLRAHPVLDAKLKGPRPAAEDQPSPATHGERASPAPTARAAATPSKAKPARSSTSPAATSRPSKSPSSPATATKLPNGGDDDALFAGISEDDRDTVWRDISAAVGEDDSSDLGPSTSGSKSSSSLGAPAKRRSAPASAREGSAPLPSSLPPPPPGAQRVLNSSGFRGFGSPSPSPPSTPAAANKAAAAAGAAAAGAATAAGAAAAAPNDGSGSRGGSASPSPSSSPSFPGQSPPSLSAAPAPGQGRLPSRSNPMRLFLFNAEAAQVTSLLSQLGLADRVMVATELRGADAIVAAKLTKSGKHANLAQAERTAANSGIPLLVVGRNMTADNLRAVLLPRVDPHAARAAGLPEAAAGGGGSSKPSAADLAAHRAAVLQGFGSMMARGEGPAEGS